MTLAGGGRPGESTRGAVVGPTASLWDVIAISCQLIANLDTFRVTKLDECGRPIVGLTNYVSECAASIAMNPDIDEQDDIIYRAANGTLCGVKRGCPTLLGFDVEINFFQASPELISVLTGNPDVLGFDGAVVGNDDCSIQCDRGFALEFWAELIAPVCSTEGDQIFLYFLLPWVTNGYINDLEIGSEAITFQLVGQTRAGGQWGTGPFDVVPTDANNTPGRLLTPLGATCHRRIQTSTVQPPTPSCEYQNTPALIP